MMWRMEMVLREVGAPRQKDRALEVPAGISTASQWTRHHYLQQKAVLECDVKRIS